MQIIKGFVSINELINNNPGVQSVLGELSTWAMTYSREKGEYQYDDILGYKLTTFRSVDSVSSAAEAVELTQAKQILNFVKTAVTYAKANIRPYDPNDFRNDLIANHYTEATSILIGAFVDNGTIALPEWISWTSTAHNNNSIKIWLADAAFTEQYDDYEILVIPPLANLDDLFGFYNAAVTTITSRTASQLTNLIQTTKGDDPETFIRMQEFTYLNKLNVDQTTLTNWTALIYGKAGDNIDAIKDAISSYILANSTHTTEEWVQIFPDIFKRTEFVILPRWDKISIPNLTVLASLYSSILDPAECLTFAKAHAAFYPANFIDLNTNIMPYDYKALSLLVINGIDNVVGKKKITDMFPDYVPLPTSSLDFNRMAVMTRDWIILVERLLVAAETATEYTVLPSDFRRVKRSNTLFISAQFDEVNFLVAAKSNAFYTVE